MTSETKKQTEVASGLY